MTPEPQPQHGLPRLPQLPRSLSAAVLVVVVSVGLVRNLPWHLDNYDQAKQAFASWEIASEGHVWFQHTPFGDIATKPPLMAWLSWLLAEIGRLPWEVAWRLPSLAAAAGVAILLWRLAAPRFGSAGGLLAVAAFGLNLLAPRLATLVRTDMLLALTILAAGALSLRHVTEDSPWTTRDRALLAAIVAVSCFLKGPILLAFVLVPLAVALLVARRWNRPALRRAWPGWWPWAAGLVPFLAWAAWGAFHDEAFRNQVVLREFAGRFTVGEDAVHNNQPPWFYLVHLLHKFAPWSLLLAASLAVAPVRRRLLADPPTLFLLAWAGTAFVVMSVVPSKRVDRIFPIVPVAALLVPAALSAWSATRLQVRGTRRLAGALLTVATLSAGGYALAKPWLAAREDHAALARFGREVRQLAHSEHLRIALVKPAHEGLFLYLRGAPILLEGHSAKLWERREIDALVVSEQRLAKIEDRLAPFDIRLEAEATLGKNRRYLLLTRPR